LGSMAAAHHSHGATGAFDSHRVSTEADRGRLGVALALILAFMAVEVVAGILADSLALLSDAAHMLTDAAAIGFALVAIRLGSRPPGGDFTFGLKRTEILAAQLNGVTLLVLGGWIVYEGIGRLVEPPQTEGTAVLAVALAGIGVNLAATAMLGGANRRSLNVEGAYQHILTDLVAFVATAVAGAIILATGFHRADGIAALLVAAIMFRAAYRLLRDSGRVLLEAAPAELDTEEIGQAMAASPKVTNVHDLHLWEVTSGFPALSAHVLVPEDVDCHAQRERLEALLRDRFGIDHVTLQVEHADEPLLQIEEAPGGPASTS
jgi:cobalt-zinc-cadmium efflux system protein